MDWTGGTRRRFAGARNNNTALQKQKAHFAKARAAIQHEPFTSHRGASASAHNDETQARAYKGTATATSLVSLRASLTWSGSGRNSMILDDNDDRSINAQRVRSTDSAANVQMHEDEELLLIARRRKLLARNDWLALDPTRPLRIGFPTTSDNDRVGRRKKVKRPSATCSKAAQRRLLTFEERLEPTAYLMSGALPPTHDEHIEIKVGTSAFDSQSRPSRKPNTPGNLSVGPQSTILSHLSEESMLLGADGDTFDADQVEVPAYVQPGHESRDYTSRPSSVDSDDQNDEETAHSRGTQGHSAELQQLEAWADDEDIYSLANSLPRSDNFTDDSLISRLAAPGTNVWDHVKAQQVHPSDHTSTSPPVDPHVSAASMDQNTLEADTEKEWRQLMGIVMQTESLTSNKAVDSSSQHLTTSESVQRDLPCNMQHEIGFDDLRPSTGVGGSSLDHVDPERYQSTLEQPRPNRVHKMVSTYAQPPTHTPKVTADDLDNEALWREFIIGSQDSESGDDLHSAWQRSRGKTRELSEQPRSLQLSGLWTSDQVTRGEAEGTSPGRFAVTDSDPNNALDLREDSIEDDALQPMPALSSPLNIHAVSTKKLDPRRFKGPTERNATTTRERNYAASRTYNLRRDTGTRR